MNVIPFRHLEQYYEIRWMYDGHTLHVRAFKNNRPADGFTYSVSSEIAFDMNTTQGTDAVAILVEDAKRAITENRWANLIDAIKQSEKESS